MTQRRSATASPACAPTSQDAAARRRRGVPFRVRLAGGHQRHARDDRVQFQGRRLLQDHRRPGADADARDPGRAREAHQGVRRARLLGSASATFAAATAASTPAAGSTKNSTQAANDEDAEAKPERLWDEARAEALRRKCEGKPGIATEEAKPTTQISPLLYDLTSLQREANGRFGFSATHHAGAGAGAVRKAQGADLPAYRCARAAGGLPADGASRRWTCSSDKGGLHAAPYAPFAAQVLKEGWVRPNKRIFDNAKISDHFAIIPTLQAPKSLSEPETKLYDMVVKRFLAVFFPAAEFLVTTRITRVEGEPFRSEGRVMVKPGWLAVYGKRGRDRRSADARRRARRQGRRRNDIEVKAEQTKPPARFSEATLLSAMEGAGKLVEDEELREAMSEKGLGTPATRASDHRGPDLRGLPAPQRPRTAAHGEGVLAHVTRSTRFGINELTLTRAHRRLGIQAQADGARRPAARRVHGPHRRGHAGPGGPHQERRRCTTSRFPRSATCPKCGGTVQENYRKFQCQAATSRSGRSSPAAHRARGSRGVVPRKVDRSAAGLPQPHGQAVRRDAEADGRLHGRIRFRPGRSPTIAMPSRSISPAKTRWGRARSAARTCSSSDGLCLREIRGPGAQLRLPLRQDHPAAADRARADGEAARHRQDRPAAPLHFQERPAVLGVPGAQPDGNVGFEFAPREAKAKTPARKTAATTNAPEEAGSAASGVRGGAGVKGASYRLQSGRDGRRDRGRNAGKARRGEEDHGGQGAGEEGRCREVGGRQGARQESGQARREIAARRTLRRRAARPARCAR